MTERAGVRRAKATNLLSLTLQPHLVQDNLPIEVASKLYIGSIHAAFNQDAIHERRITHVLNASGLPATFPRHFTYLSIDLRDKEAANILTCIPASLIFIESGLAEGAVLVHCAGGRSRSAALITAYLMATRRWSFDYAMGVLKNARPVIQINKGFEQQLRAFGAHLCDVYAAHQFVLRQRLRVFWERRGHAARRTGQTEDRLEASRRRSSLGLSGSASDISVSSPVPSLRRDSMDDTGGGRVQMPHTASSRRRGPRAVETQTVAHADLSYTRSISFEGCGDCSGLEEYNQATQQPPLWPGMEASQIQSDLYPQLDLSASRRNSMDGLVKSPVARSVNRTLHRRGKTLGTGLYMLLVTPSMSSLTSAARTIQASSPMQVVNQPSSSVRTPSPLALRNNSFASTSRINVEGGAGGAETPSVGCGNSRIPHVICQPQSPDGSPQDHCGGSPASRQPSTPVLFGRGAVSISSPRERQSSSIHPDAVGLARNRLKYRSAPPGQLITMPPLKSSKHELHAQTAPTAQLRLSRPSTQAVYIIPQLQAFEQAFACAVCQTRLFSMSNVIHLDTCPSSIPATTFQGSPWNHHAIQALVSGQDHDWSARRSSLLSSPPVTPSGQSLSASRASSCSPAMAHLPSPGVGSAVAHLSPRLSGLRQSASFKSLEQLASQHQTCSDQDSLGRPAATANGGPSFVESTTGSNSPLLPAVGTLSCPLPLERSLRRGSMTCSSQASPDAAETPDLISRHSRFRFDHVSTPSPRPSQMMQPIISDTDQELQTQHLGGVAAQMEGCPETAFPQPSVYQNTYRLRRESSSIVDKPQIRCEQQASDGWNGDLSASNPGSSPTSQGWAFYRPQAADIRRSLGGMRALEDCLGGSDSYHRKSLDGSVTGPVQPSGSLKVVQKDYQACVTARTFNQRWIPVEYMPWMTDKVLLEENGSIVCANANCAQEVGRWDWDESLGADGTELGELPFLGIDKTKLAALQSPTHKLTVLQQHGSLSVRRPSQSMQSPREASSAEAILVC